MKKIYLFFACGFLVTSAFSQTDSTDLGIEGLTTTRAQAPSFTRSYAVKLNPGSFAFGKLSLAGEWNFRPKRSVTFYLGIPMEAKVPSTIANSLIGEDAESPEVKYKTFSIGAGYRMYMGKRDMTGFYFEPIIKYVNFKMAGTYTGKFDFGGTYGEQTIDALATNEYSGFGITAQLGVQFMIAKRVTFDLYILGPEANMGKVSATVADVSGPGTDQYWENGDRKQIEQTMKDNLKNIPIIGDKIEVEANKDGKYLKAEYKGFVPGLRAGLTIGVRF